MILCFDALRKTLVQSETSSRQRPVVNIRMFQQVNQRTTIHATSGHKYTNKLHAEATSRSRDRRRLVSSSP
ncbi:Thiol protease [Fusarium oxysporum f. sp. albedinis]|nr:Thiol protease [Fusarium oxysporum f. sp. albedinis]